MKAKDKYLKGTQLLENYVSQINWDWLFFKAQSIFGGILVLGLVFFLFWVAG